MRDYGRSNQITPEVVASMHEMEKAISRKWTQLKIWLENKFPFGFWCETCGTPLGYVKSYANTPKSACPKCQPELEYED